MNKYVYVDIPVPKTWTFTELDVLPNRWAREHCASYITNDPVQHNGEYYYRFYFGNKQDQVLFALRWA